jgi:hypothetical protein
MDKEKGSWRESVDGALAKTSSPPAETQFGTVTPATWEGEGGTTSVESKRPC